MRGFAPNRETGTTSKTKPAFANANAAPQSRSVRKNSVCPSRRLLHRRRCCPRWKRRRTISWPVSLSHTSGRVFLPTGWIEPALRCPDRTSDNEIRRSAWRTQYAGSIRTASLCRLRRTPKDISQTSVTPSRGARLTGVSVLRDVAASAAATPTRSSELIPPKAAAIDSDCAPEDGRTPINTD